MSNISICANWNLIASVIISDASALCDARFSYPSVVSHSKSASFSGCIVTDSSHTSFNFAKQTVIELKRAKHTLCTRENNQVLSVRAQRKGRDSERRRRHVCSGGGKIGGGRIVLTMFRARKERMIGCAEITDQGVSKQLRCRQEVRPGVAWR